MCFTNEKKVFDQRACTFFKVSDSRWVFYFHSSQPTSTFHSFRSLPLVRQHGTKPVPNVDCSLFCITVLDKTLPGPLWIWSEERARRRDCSHLQCQGYYESASSTKNIPDDDTLYISPRQIGEN